MSLIGRIANAFAPRLDPNSLDWRKHPNPESYTLALIRAGMPERECVERLRAGLLANEADRDARWAELRHREMEAIRAAAEAAAAEKITRLAVGGDDPEEWKPDLGTRSPSRSFDPNNFLGDAWSPPPPGYIYRG